MLQLEKDLKSRFNDLNAEKQSRLDRLKTRSKVDQDLCDALSLTPYYIPTGTVPTAKQLKELDEHIETLEAEQVLFCYICFNIEHFEHYYNALWYVAPNSTNLMSLILRPAM